MNLPNLDHWLTMLMVLTFFRALDMVSTFMAAPDLHNELNPVIRHLGWQKSIILNALCCPVMALFPALTVTLICVGSMVAATWNFCIWSRKL